MTCPCQEFKDLQDYIKNHLSRNCIGDKMKNKPFYKQKTFWSAALLAGTVALPAFVPMTPAKVDAIRVLLVAITAIFLRQGVNK